jgi:hypothetical protein
MRPDLSCQRSGFLGTFVNSIESTAPALAADLGNAPPNLRPKSANYELAWRGAQLAAKPKRGIKTSAQI